MIAAEQTHTPKNLGTVREPEIVHEEKIIVWTHPAKGTKRWTYTIEETDAGYEVTSRREHYGKYNKTTVKEPKSTQAVREYVSEKFGIELVN